MSQGMLCSGDELGLTDDADGILILDADTRIGLDLADLAGDIVLDVDVKPNRGDALSILGLAREVAAATRARSRWPDLTSPSPAMRRRRIVRVDVEDARLCSRFVGRYMDGVTVGPSPWEVQRRLIAAGQRPVSNVVDASNYVMLELGKPVHTFDAAAVSAARSTSACARPGERLETLDHVMRDLDDRYAPHRRRARTARASRASWAEPRARSRTRPARSSSSRRSSTRSASAGRPSATRSGARRASASRRARTTASRPWAPTGQPRSSAAGPAGGSRSGSSTRTRRRPSPCRIAFRPPRVDRLLGEPIPVDEQRDLLARVGVTTEPASERDAVPIIVGSAPVALRAEEVGARSSRRCRRTGATSTSRPTSSRRSPGSAATRRSVAGSRTR